MLSNRSIASCWWPQAAITTWKELTRALELLKQLKAPVLGTLCFTDCRDENSYGGAYRYTYGASDSTGTEGGRKRRAAKKGEGRADRSLRQG